jgi:16S rRNA (guanine(527)-N(7))-methyltransferase RsmG
MGATLPNLDRALFRDRLRACSPRALGAGTEDALWAHYQELRRWNERLSLVGPGTAEDVIERHYGEALAALPLLDGAATLLDVGSGAGFPGLVLAAALPGLAVTLVEAQERKWAFLAAAARRARLSCNCLNARVSAALEMPSVDVVTWRAVRLPPPAVAALAASSDRMLLWSGADEPAPPAGWHSARRVSLAGSAARQIVEWTASPRGKADR